MKANDIYDVSAELEQEFGAKGTPQREAAINHAWEEYNAQILLDARKNVWMQEKMQDLHRRNLHSASERTKAIFPE